MSAIGTNDYIQAKRGDSMHQILTCNTCARWLFSYVGAELRLGVLNWHGALRHPELTDILLFGLGSMQQFIAGFINLIPCGYV